MQNKNKTISRHCGRGPAIQGCYKEKTTSLNRLDPGYPAGRPSGMTATKAFTLIELLVVVLIIGILAAVAVPQYNKVVTIARLKNMSIAAHSIARAQQEYFLANGTYATKAEDLGGLYPGTTNFSIPNQGTCIVDDITNKRVQCFDVKGLVAYFVYYEGKNQIQCCSYPQSQYAADAFCQQETGKKRWGNGCGSAQVCHCYLK